MWKKSIHKLKRFTNVFWMQTQKSLVLNISNKNPQICNCNQNKCKLSFVNSTAFVCKKVWDSPDTNWFTNAPPPQGIACRWILTAARCNFVPGHAADIFCLVSSSVTTSTMFTVIRTSLIKCSCLHLRLSTFQSLAGGSEDSSDEQRL